MRLQMLTVGPTFTGTTNSGSQDGRVILRSCGGGAIGWRTGYLGGFGDHDEAHESPIHALVCGQKADIRPSAPDLFIDRY